MADEARQTPKQPRLAKDADGALDLANSRTTVRSSMGVDSAAVLHLDELDGDRVTAGMSVRVLGELTEIDLEAGRAIIEQREASLAVDLRAIEGYSFHLGDLLQLFGELVPNGDDKASAASCWLLRARIARNVLGLNVELYERAVEAKRAFERDVR
jgi:hypothetical protein